VTKIQYLVPYGDIGPRMDLFSLTAACMSYLRLLTPEVAYFPANSSLNLLPQTLFASGKRQETLLW
jgi:hypothetical protein